jgi:hypothetical protein
MKWLALSTVALLTTVAIGLSASSCKKSATAAAADMTTVDLARVRCLAVTDAGVTYGCLGGSMGPGDRDDGGGMQNVGPPDASPDAMNLPLGAECLNNGQCASGICYYYRVKGQFCTQLCSVDSDCPPPSPGCGGMFVCRYGN